MKILFLFLITVCVEWHAAAQSSFAGDWEGRIGAVRLILHVTEKDGKLAATLDSPDQGAKGLPCDEVIVKNDSISIKLNMANAAYNGLLATDKSSITG